MRPTGPIPASKGRWTHGWSRHPMYLAWQTMLQRCENPKAESYENYGGRGVVVCERWHDFSLFLTDMGERPPGKSLDRFPNPNGNYEPGNCRWASRREQNTNKRQTGTGVSYRQKTDQWIARAHTPWGEVHLYCGRDMFEAYCARKSWEAKRAA